MVFTGFLVFVSDLWYIKGGKGMGSLTALVWMSSDRQLKVAI